ncbi:MAG: gliding motility-associated C-terminal domain-containing protein [Bacteroidota bacterium]
MNKIVTKFFQILAFVASAQQIGFSQTCPSVNAQAGTGASTTICSGSCANLSATVVPVNATNTYTVGSIPYTPFPFSGGTPAISNIVDDVWSSPINIGFNFCYFGTTFNQLLVGANGEITFNITTPATESWSISATLPNLIDHPGNTICAPYRDIDPSDVGSSVNYYVTGTAPCRRFVAYWNNAPLLSCVNPKSTFQIVLYEGTNIIETHILNSSGTCPWQGGKGLIGIQNATGTTAVAPAGRNVLTAWSATSESWRFTPTGTPNYTVNWSGPNGFTATGLTAAPCPTATSNYTATMNVANCGGGSTAFTSVVQVSVTPTPTLFPVASPTAICRGNSSTLSATGATSYTWNPGAVTASSVAVSPTITTIYTVTGANGSCVSTQTISLTVNANPTVNATRSPSLICGTGSSTLTGSGASTYTWNPGGISGNPVVVSPTVTTIYTVTGTSILGCNGTRTLNVIVGQTPTITASSSAATVCANSTVTLMSSGGTSYTWTPGPIVGATVVATPTANTIYTVTGRNATGCTSTNTVGISVTPGITITPVASPTSICSGASSTLTVSGATSYTWMPGAISGSVTVVTPTTTTIYTVTGTSAGCSNTKTISVVVNTPVITASKNPSILCAGNSATLTATGASTYTWNPGSITGNTIVVSPTITTLYTVTATNTLGCVGTRTINLPVSANPTVTPTASSASICLGSSTTLTVSGATTYTWMPGSTTGTVAVVSPTTTTNYTVTGRNTSGCISTGTIDITVHPTVTVTPSASSTLICRGSSSTLTATGANTYTWNPGSLTGSTVAVSPSVTTTYSITGTATTGCVGTTTLSITVSTIAVTAASNPTILCNTSSATLTSTGATSYTWNPGGVTGNTIVVTPTATTVYTVTGTNTVGCTATRTLNLSVGVTPTITAAASPTLLCSGATVTLSSSGATTYTWLPGSVVGATITRSPTVSTTYTVRGRDASSGCIGTNTVFVTVNPNPTVSATNSPTVICPGNSATLTANGASSYTWNPGALTGSTTIVTPTVTTIYTVIATSSLGCTGSSTVNLKVNPTPTVNATSSPTAICIGDMTILTGTGASTYTWNPGGLTGATVAVTPTITTTYTITGLNNGCSDTGTLSVVVNPNPTITSSSSPTIICPGSSATLTANGGTTYTWTPGNLTGNTVVVSPTVTTTYSVVGTNSLGCTNTSTVLLTLNSSPSISVTSSPTIICSGASSTLTASGASTYTWNPGTLTGSSVAVTPTTTTIYTVTGTSASGCTNTNTVSLTVSNPTVNAVSNPTTLCIGSTATLTGTGASTYTWNPGALTGSTIAVSPTATTIYSVVGTNTDGCISPTHTISLTVAPIPTISAVSNPTAICAGSSATLTGNGATTYTWNPGALTGTNVVVSPSATTVYTVTGNNGSCSNTSTVSLTVNSLPTLTATSNPTAVCAGSSATLTGNGATTYTWNPGALTGSTVTVTPTATTVYTVIGTSALGCTNTTTVSLTVNSNPSFTAAAAAGTICAGSTTTLGALGAVSYTWNPGGVTGFTVAVSPTVTTTYTVTGANAAGCTSTNTVDVNVVPNFTVSAVSNPTAICAGVSATLTGSGATSYTWNPGALTGTTTVVSPTATTIYTVTGSNGICANTATVSLTVNTTLTVTATSNPTVLCVGNTATLTSIGASTYTWNPGALTGSTISVTPTTTTIYTVNATDAMGCTATQTVDVTVSNPTVAATASSNTICAGQTTTLTGSGAATYTWNPGALTGNSVVVSPTVTTTYTITDVNVAGCTATNTITINVIANPTITASASPTVICSGSSSTLTANGSSTYTWSPGALTGTMVAVTPTITTTYTVMSDNGIGCTNSETVTVTVNSNPTLTLSASSNTICAGNSGTLTAMGATSYTWNPGALTTASVVVTPTATTAYTVTGTNGTCSTTQTISLSVSPSLTVTASATSNSICAGSTTTLTGSGATSYTWNPGALTGTAVAVSPTVTTTYTVDGDNSLGCAANNTITITVNSAPSVSITASSTALCVGSVTLTASGGTTYTWSPVTATTTAIVDSPTITTTYTVVSDNGTGCIGMQTITVNVGANPTLTLSASANTVCIGNSSTLNASGANTYTWNPGTLTGSTTVVSPTTATTYTVTGDNGGGCTNTETITISVGPALSVTATASSNTICAGSSATLTGNGATSYTWNPGAITGSTTVVSPTVTTTYTVDADNGTGCVANATVTINVNAIPSVSISATTTLLCSSGTVTMTASGATSYTWIPLAAVTATVFDNPSVTTTYTVTGADAAGCSNTQTIIINVGTTPTVSASSTSTTICAGASATLTGNGASTYTWNPGALTGTTTVVTPSVTTTYTIDGDNGTGCIGTNTITINVNSIPSLSIAATSTALCSAGSITLTASGGTTYTWSPVSATTASVVDSPTITTTYTVASDNGGCIGTQTITVNVGTSPTMTITASPVGTICVGTTATLTASGAASYTWNPTGATTNSITDAPSVTTTYTIIGDNGFGCTATNTFVLNVASGTSITAVANPTAACANSTVSLSASGATTYTWLPMNVSGATVTATPSVSTTYTVLGDNGTCVASSTVFVTVDPGPANVTATVSGDITCLTSSVDLFGSTTSSPVVYLWTGPSSYTSSTQNPTGITEGGVYTLGVVDLLTGCVNTATVSVVTNTTIPGLTVTTSGSLGCAGTITLTAASTTTNTLTYNWSGPSSFTSAVQSPTTSVAGDYTVNVADALTGCNTTATVTVGTGTATVGFTATASGSLTCIGDVTLTATPSSTNAVTYAWSGPSSFTSTVQSPTTTVAGDYTISVTDVASGCSSTSTITVGTNTVGPNLTATTSGSLGCATSVTLTASTTETNTLTYSWSGPSSFTSTAQSPTATVTGDYTVTANDAITGCSSTSSITVGTNTTIPTVGIGFPGPVLGCNSTVTLSVITAITPTMSFSWSGPSSFTSTAQTPTTSVEGDYTVTVTDPTNGCSNTVTVTVTTDTTVPVFSATVIPATCTGTVSNNDGTIIISGYGSTDTYDLSQAATYTGTATYVTGSTIPFGGTLTNTLTNPATAIPYTIRVFSANGCFADLTVTLTPVTCSTTTSSNVLGMTKAVSTPTFVNNNAYNVTYTVVATNASTVDLTNFSIIDNLNSTFPLPTTYSVISTPVVTSLNSSLTVNAGYDGSTQNDMLMPLTSTLTAGRKDTIVFTVQINPNGFFGPFKNSAIGSGFDGAITVSDSSNTGFAWDPDNDGDPTNNDTATVVSLNPNSHIGVAKSGIVSEVLADKTLDVTYTITVKNLGNDTIRFVQVFDTLNIPSPAQYTIKSGPSASGSLSANGNYNGVTDIGMLDANLSKLAPGQIETITLILNITPNDVKSITNIAIGAGFGTDGGIVRDSSNTGTEADPNGNGDATEPGENVPTVLELPDVELFIPEVFTPDGDGKNDFFVIKGISGRTVKITVFNRWGNKVYANDAYDNTWNGTPNVSGLIIGNSTLPQGTYYYIVEFEDGEDEPVNGYVVLQY